MKTRKEVWGAFCLLATVMLIVGCGGGGGGEEEAAGNTVSLTGTVTAPSASISAPLGISAFKGLSKVTEAAAFGVEVHIYTLEGEDLGTAITDSIGAVTLSVDLATLKGSDDTGTTWTEPVILDAENGIQTYAEVEVTEGTTTTVDLGTANMDTTLAAQAIADKIEGWAGWGSAYKDLAAGLDMGCIFEAQKAMWENAALGGEGIADDIGAIKETMMGFMAGGGDPATYGFSGFGGMFQSVMSGEAGDQWTDIASFADVTSDYSTTFAAFDAVDNTFASQFATGGYGVTTLNIAKVDVATGSICDDIKAGTLDMDALVKPMMASDDEAAFTATYGAEGGMAVYFGLLDQCTTTGDCSDMVDKPGAYYGFMSSYGGDYSSVYSGGTFDSTAVAGMYMAAGACAGSTVEAMKDCGMGMYGTYAAAGSWDSFMTGGEFNQDTFTYYGGYYTGQVATGTWDPGTMTAGDYQDVWTGGQDYAGNTETMDAVQQCIDQKVAAGSYDFSSCYGEEYLGPPPGGDIAGTYIITESTCGVNVPVGQVLPIASGGAADTYTLGPDTFTYIPGGTCSGTMGGGEASFTCDSTITGLGASPPRFVVAITGMCTFTAVKQ